MPRPERSTSAAASAAPHLPVPSSAPTPPAEHRGRKTATGALLVFTLGSLTALPPLSIDMYIPALPTVTHALHSDASTVQLTLTACLAGLALGQLVLGPLSDSWGRRRPLVAGMVLFVIASLLCAVAPTAPMLTGLRLIQGASGAAGVVIARAIVRDLYSGVAAARYFSSLMLVSGVAPIAAPVIGGQLLRITSWRGIFVLLVVLGSLILLLAAIKLPETLPPERRHRGGLRTALRTMRGLGADRVFSGYVLAGGITFAAMFAYISGSSFVVQDVYHASPQTYSLLFGVNSVGIVAMGQLNGRVLVRRFSLVRLLGTGIALALAAGVGLLLVVSLTDAGLTAVAVLLWLMVASMGMVMPNATALALGRADHSAGSASALLGTLQFLIGAAAAPLVGLGGTGSALPMAIVITGATVLAMAVFLTLCRPWQHTHPADA
ncbi:Bcr/CflA family drug resistance efflux transporter [Mangrovactinospora gilvigrisea]|uniref:Bcr/CflA family drug resistance efflux transporter n=1 Tax=Mangrovactinospora gilvigrisea TaxID=1428644 RepID=A0A1J7B9E9_9ACTN|nr:Bcr/CflA family multidrug efflux MFS transporter [Mangrovactinospora gilvigrisea]OIV35267.1 Bcr/CflA family drug resistance efflux transporter [Mangrovactinospora gilvigrisea]